MLLLIKAMIRWSYVYWTRNGAASVWRKLTMPVQSVKRKSPAISPMSAVSVIIVEVAIVGLGGLFRMKTAFRRLAGKPLKAQLCATTAITVWIAPIRNSSGWAVRFPPPRSVALLFRKSPEISRCMPNVLVSSVTTKRSTIFWSTRTRQMLQPCRLDLKWQKLIRGYERHQTIHIFASCSTTHTGLPPRYFPSRTLAAVLASSFVKYSIKLSATISHHLGFNVSLLLTHDLFEFCRGHKRPPFDRKIFRNLWGSAIKEGLNCGRKW